MKSLAGTLLALAFVCFSLVSLMTVNRTWDDSLVQLADRESRVSELGLRASMRR